MTPRFGFLTQLDPSGAGTHATEGGRSEGIFDSVWKRVFSYFLRRKARLWLSSAKSLFFSEGDWFHVIKAEQPYLLLFRFSPPKHAGAALCFFVLSMSTGAVTASVTDQGSPGTSQPCYCSERFERQRMLGTLSEHFITVLVPWFVWMLLYDSRFGDKNIHLPTISCQPAYQHFDPLP